MRVTVIKHGERSYREYEWLPHIEKFTDFLAYHGFTHVLYDKDDFQQNPLITDVVVLQRHEMDDANPLFWLTVTLGGEVHDVVCWTMIDLFETFTTLKLLPNVS